MRPRAFGAEVAVPSSSVPLPRLRAVGLAAVGLALVVMRLTEFWERMETRFGAAYADSVARDQVIGRLGDRTIYQAFEAGESAKDVWRAVCEHFEIPVPERH